MDKQQRYDLYKYAIGPGWWPILDKYLPMIQEADPEAEISMKEKFGFLRLDVFSHKAHAVNAMEYAAEMVSTVTCECCGRPGKLRPRMSWKTTLCNRCHRLGANRREKIYGKTEQLWLADELPAPVVNYEKRSAPKDLAEYGIDFVVSEELRCLIGAMLDSLTNGQQVPDVPGYEVALGIAEHLAAGRLTIDDANSLYVKFIRDIRELAGQSVCDGQNSK